jgi:hypothetical protein
MRVAWDGALEECHAQGSDDETSIKDLVHGPADDAPSIEIPRRRRDRASPGR